MRVKEANRVRACLDCGSSGALLWRTTKGERPGRLLRICDACLRKDDWHRFGLVEREPLVGEVPTEFFEGEWHFPEEDGPAPWAVLTYADEPSPETGHVGWCWWALGMMGDAPTYEAAKRKAETWIQARINGMGEPECAERCACECHREDIEDPAPHLPDCQWRIAGVGL